MSRSPESARPSRPEGPSTGRQGPCQGHAKVEDVVVEEEVSRSIRSCTKEKLCETSLPTEEKDAELEEDVAELVGDANWGPVTRQEKTDPLAGFSSRFSNSPSSQNSKLTP